VTHQQWPEGKATWPDRRLIDLLGIEHPLVLAPGDQVVLGQPGEFRRRAIQAGVPGDEVQQIVTVSTSCRCRQIVGRQAIKEGLQPGWWASIAELGYIARHVDPHDSNPVYGVQYGGSISNMACILHCTP
jgi:hypothetical protein